MSDAIRYLYVRTSGPSNCLEATLATRGVMAGFRLPIGPQRHQARARFRHLYRRRLQPIKNRLAIPADAPESQHARRAALHASRAAHALRIFHRAALIGEAHDVDALVADRRTNIARNAFFFFRKDSKAR